MTEFQQKNLVIVHNDDTKQSAEFLIGLIGNMANAGLPINAQPMHEKVYADNIEVKNAKQKILFLGNFPESKIAIENTVSLLFDRFGIRYGWNGNRAAMTFKKIPEDRFKALADFAEKEFSHEENVIKTVDKKGLDPRKHFDDFKTRAIGAIVAAMLPPTLSTAAASSFMLTNKNKLDAKQMMVQQQRFAVAYFSMKHLNDFMGFKDE